MLFLVMGFVGSAWAQVAWQTGDVFVCHSTGQCNVLRITGSTATFLNQLSDGLGGTTSNKAFGAAMDNTLHLLVTDAGGANPITGNSGSNIAKYSIASVDPLSGATISPHTVLHVFDASNGGASSNIRGLAVNSAGQMFAGNAGNGSTVSASIVQIDQDRPQWLANTAYAVGFTILDPALHVQMVTMAGTSGATQPTFSDSRMTTTDGGVTWTDEGLTVSSFTLPNVTTPGWTASTAYPITSSAPNVNQILDPNGHKQTVLTPGTSGAPHYPPFNQFGGTTNDNAVTWTDEGNWQPNTVYPTTTNPSLSTVGDTNFHLWLATPFPATNATGISGPPPPPFLQNEGGMVTDGLQWQQSGTVCGDSCTSLWTPGTQYSTGSQIDDNVGSVWNAISSGTSGAMANRPAFESNEAQNTVLPDNALTWTDKGSFAWQANHHYTKAAINTDPNGVVVDPAGHVQEVTTDSGAGKSGPVQPGTPALVPPNPNPWTDSSPPSFGGTTIDGLQWTDVGAVLKGQPCIENQLASLDLSSDGGTVYSTSGFSSLAPGGFQGGIIQQVTTSPSLGNCTVFANFGPNVTLHGIRVVPPNSMPTNCMSPTLCPNTNGGILVVATGTQFVASDNDLPGVTGNGSGDATEFSSGQEIQDICTGTSLSPMAAPPGPPATDSCALLLDASTGAIVARYPAGTGTSLQALTLNPLVTDCTGGNPAGTACNSGYTPAPKVSNFWLGDGASNSGLFFSVDFAMGTPTQYNANTACPPGPTPCVDGIESLAIYGGEGANQAGLASLFLGSVTPTGNTKLVRFLSNSETVIASNLPAGSTGLNLYASLIDGTTCFNDQGVQCRPTTPTTKGLLWKIDIPTGSTNPNPLVAAKFASTVPGAIDTGTEVIYDAFTDITSGVGNNDPWTPPTRPSLRGLYEATNNGVSETDFGCKYLSPAPKCFKFPGTIPVKFTCNNLPAGFLLKNYGLSQTTPWGPRLEIQQSTTTPPIPTCSDVTGNTAPGGSAPGGTSGVLGSVRPLNCTTQLPSTNKATTYRFDPTSTTEAPNGFFVFNWLVPSVNRTYSLCTYDDTDRALPLCEQPIVVASSCK
jgi:hypothetical protein